MIFFEVNFNNKLQKMQILKNNMEYIPKQPQKSAKGWD